MFDILIACLVDPPGDITGANSPPKRFLTLDFVGPQFTKMPMTWSPDVTLVSVKEKFRSVMKCLKILSKFAKSLTCGASISWGRSRLHEGTNIYLWLSTTCQNGLKRKRSPHRSPTFRVVLENLIISLFRPIRCPTRAHHKVIRGLEPIFAMTSLQRSCLNIELLTVSPPRITHKQVGKLRYPIVA
ncbi:hypothetical protein Tco_0922143 [Tanacetum coccineum]|uniref:Uncharacterized protein n=1 Tax=Tanacetum coccineum TaxID=301880 RepID=A0ABQ5D3R2_9ASTR